MTDDSLVKSLTGTQAHARVLESCWARAPWLTENVRDFAPLLRRAEKLGQAAAPLPFTSSRTFPRSRRNLGPLIDAFDAWLRAVESNPPPLEDWLQRA